MTTTYSTPLRLAIQETGDNANTWGDILNDNTIELIEQAIAETSSIDLTVGTGSYTLTTANGSADEARRAVLRFHGAPSVDRTVIVPSVSKLYVVQNDFSNTRKVTVSTGTGNTVEFSQTECGMVYVDGTEVFAVGSGGALLRANNLSDLLNVATARTNLDVYSKSEVDTLIGAVASAVVGEIRMWPTGTAPTKWLICDGSEISRTTYASLFAVLGTTYGAGNGSTTFNLPNFKGRSPIGAGQGNTAEGGGAGTNRSLGAIGGAETHTLVSGELASHSHGPGTLKATSDSHRHFMLANVTATSAYPDPETDQTVAKESSTVGNYDYELKSAGANISSPFVEATVGLTSPAEGDVTIDSGTTATTGSGTAHNNMHPFQVVNFIIFSNVT